MNFSLLVVLSYLHAVSAFPFLAGSFAASPLSRTPNTRSDIPAGPVHLARRGAEPYNPKYPYTGALINGLPGTQKGGVQVPAPGDTAHQYQDPPAGAARGPCPGLNAAANHGFLSRDGITTFNELVAAQQNVYNVGWDLAVALATAGVAFDGDVITGKVSIGTDRTSQTSPIGGILGKEPGLVGHNKFEADASLTRNDFYLANGDDYSFNATLFKMMTATAGSTSSPSAPLYDFKAMAEYRYQRYQQSLADNGNFYFGAKALLLYGAASFLYELFPSQNNNLSPDAATIQSFFGAIPDGKGGYTQVGERIPPNWTNRVIPYTLVDVVVQISTLFLVHPVLFGGNIGKGNFLGLTNFGYTGQLGSEGVCFLQQALLEDVPGTAQGPIQLPLEILTYLATSFGKVFGPFGCPAVPTS